MLTFGYVFMGCWIFGWICLFLAGCQGLYIGGRNEAVAPEGEYYYV